MSSFFLLADTIIYFRWEIHRPDVKVDVRFYGHSQRIDRGRAIWTAGQEVNAIAYDVPVPGCKYSITAPQDNTSCVFWLDGGRNTNNLRLWDARPKSGFDLMSFNGARGHSQLLLRWLLITDKRFDT